MAALSMTTALRRVQRPAGWAGIGLLVSLFGCAAWQDLRDGLGRERARPPGIVRGRVEPAPSVGATGPMLVVLEPLRDARSRERDDGLGPREIRIRSGQQEPPIALVSGRQGFRFRNLDPIHHEPFSMDARNAFRVRVEGGALSEPVRLSQGGFVRVFCRLHPTETFALVVSEARRPLAAPLAAEGRFSFSGLSSGSYRLRAVGVDAESGPVRIDVPGGETVHVELGLRARTTP
ncbi:MAG: hypothetical protein ACX98W_08120 [bacterium]